MAHLAYCCLYASVRERTDCSCGARHAPKGEAGDRGVPYIVIILFPVSFVKLNDFITTDFRRTGGKSAFTPWGKGLEGLRSGRDPLVLRTFPLL